MLPLPLALPVRLQTPHLPRDRRPAGTGSRSVNPPPSHRPALHHHHPQVTPDSRCGCNLQPSVQDATVQSSGRSAASRIRGAVVARRRVRHLNFRRCYRRCIYFLQVSPSGCFLRTLNTLTVRDAATIGTLLASATAAGALPAHCFRQTPPALHPRSSCSSRCIVRDQAPTASFRTCIAQFHYRIGHPDSGV